MKEFLKEIRNLTTLLNFIFFRNYFANRQYIFYMKIRIELKIPVSIFYKN